MSITFRHCERGVSPLALDEATIALLSVLAQGATKPLQEQTPQEAREVMANMPAADDPGPEMERVEYATVDGTFGVRVLVPTGTPRAVIIYYHGGGWVVGDIDVYDHLGRLIAQRSGCAVVMVDYRLAPEHRFPAAVEDAWAALRWAHERVKEIAGAVVPLVVAGDSAGGNLAAIVARWARDRGGPELAAQMLIYPATDCDLGTASYTAPENQLLVSRDSMIWFWDHYLPAAADRENPDASPLRAADLNGLPPAVVLTAEYDVLRDEGEAYARRLSEAGVPVRQRRADGQMHGFFSFVGLLPGVSTGLDYLVAELDRCLDAK
jgi:acetyl esterase